MVLDTVTIVLDVGRIVLEDDRMVLDTVTIVLDVDIMVLEVDRIVCTHVNVVHKRSRIVGSNLVLYRIWIVGVVTKRKLKR